jgi:hypothetical protein
MLVNLDDDVVLPDIDAIDRISAHRWGSATLEALVRAKSVRETAGRAPAGGGRRRRTMSR